MFLSLLMLLGLQNASAAAANWQDGVFNHGVWKGQCWPHGLKAGPLCRVAGGQAGKLWVMLERGPTKLDVYASGGCSEDLPPVTVPQAQLAGADRVKAVNAAIAQAAAKANTACKSQEVFAGSEADLAAVLAETDMIVGAAKQ